MVWPWSQSLLVVMLAGALSRPLPPHWHCLRASRRSMSRPRTSRCGIPWFLPLFVMLAGCVLLLARPLAVSSPKREQAFLLLLVLAAIGMLQFPFSAPIYFYTHRCWPLLRYRWPAWGASAPSHNAAGIPRLCGHISECRLCLEHRRRPSSRIRGHRYQTADPVTTAHPSR